MNSFKHPALVLCALLAALQGFGTALAADGAKKPVHTQTDLPRYSYPLAMPASQFVTVDDAAFKPFAEQVLANVNATLDGYDIQDRATLRGELGLKLSAQSVLGQDEAALATIAALRELQDKDDLRLTTGLSQEAILKARLSAGAANGPAYEVAVGKNYTDAVNALPWNVVADAIKESKTGLDVRTPGLVIGFLQHDIDPSVAQSGSVSEEGAGTILASRNYLRNVQPVQAQLLATLKSYVLAHNVEKPDIWAAREVTLDAGQKLTPVRVAIWDSGVDTTLFPKQLYTDPNPGLHSPHGMAFDLQGNISRPDLEPQAAELSAAYPRMVDLFQGFDDLDNQIDSPEADKVRAWTQSTPADQMPTLIKQLNAAENYSHGTHVAGIVARGNPAVRLVVARFNDGLPDYPFAPTVAWATKMAHDFEQLGTYFRTHNVRVVNMSWGDFVAEFEVWLGKTSPEQDPAKRKAEAAAIYKVWREGIEQAIRNAPDTLFIAAAGNDDDNAGFKEDVPASLHLPNLIAVGAVNQAGEATTFTSYGDTVLVYSAGYRVESVVPGGRPMRFSGTSMASPNVVNLAAKLLALNPKLTPAQVIDLIKRGSDLSTDGRMHLINPKRSVALLH